MATCSPSSLTPPCDKARRASDVEMGEHWFFIDSSKAERVLGFTARDPMETLAATIAYVRRKYGEGSVAQIGTFGTLAAKAAITDVGRVLGWPVPRVNALKALVPEPA